MDRYKPVNIYEFRKRGGNKMNFLVIVVVSNKFMYTLFTQNT